MVSSFLLLPTLGSLRSWCGLYVNSWVQSLVASGICATGLTICKGVGLLGLLVSGCYYWVVYVGLVYVCLWLLVAIMAVKIPLSSGSLSLSHSSR